MKKTFFLIILIFFALESILAQTFVYQTKVLDYAPAPGQFIDYKRYLKEGQDSLSLSKEDVLEQLTESMYNNVSHLLSLGAYGGSVVFGFDQSIVNVQGNYDFKVYGNAMYRPGYMLEDDTVGGSTEPGIVMVSRDDNKNGLADDTWYELAGSEYNSEKTIKNYSITYYNPDSLYSDILWRDNQGDSGYVSRMSFHRQSTYYPIWLNKDSLVIKGNLLAENAVNLSNNPNIPNYLLVCYDYGYADNHANSNDYSSFKIEWAVDSFGNEVLLPSIDFVKIYTGINAYYSNLGELSTEVAGIEILNKGVQNTDYKQGNKSMEKLKVYPNPFVNKIRVDLPKGINFEHEILILYSLDGKRIFEWDVQNKTSIECDLAYLKRGIYILKLGSLYTKIVKQY